MKVTTPAKAPARLKGEPPAPLAPNEALIWHAGRLRFRRLDPDDAHIASEKKLLAPANSGRALSPAALVRAGLYGGHN